MEHKAANVRAMPSSVDTPGDLPFDLTMHSLCTAFLAHLHAASVNKTETVKRVVLTSSVAAISHSAKDKGGTAHVHAARIGCLPPLPCTSASLHGFFAFTTIPMLPLFPSRQPCHSKASTIFKLSLYNLFPTGAPFTEEDWNTRSNLNDLPYCHSKAAAEKRAWDIAKEQSRWDMVSS